MSKIKPTKAWAGIVGSRIDKGMDREQNFKDGQLAIFKTRREARKLYECVIPVVIKTSARHALASRPQHWRTKGEKWIKT